MKIIVLLLVFCVGIFGTGLIQQTDWVKFGIESNAKTEFPWWENGRINWNAEKIKRGLQVTEITIHHTGEQFIVDFKHPDDGILKLSEVQKDRLYRPRFEKSKDPEPQLFGFNVPIQSGNFLNLNGQKTEVFVAYHNLIMQNVKFLKLLEDDVAAWHAGNWDRNQVSVAIVLDGNYTDAMPSSKMLDMLAKRIAYFRNKFPIQRIVSHNEVRPEPTSCPGKWFGDEIRKSLWDKSSEYLVKKKFK